MPDLPDPAYSRVLDHISSDAVTTLPESSRLPLWETLVDLVSKHRKYADAQRAMSAEIIAKIEGAAAKLAPTSTSLLQRRLFSERDFDLYEENGDFEEQRLKLDQKRQTDKRTKEKDHGRSEHSQPGRTNQNRHSLNRMREK